MRKIGFIGLGAMGLPMSSNLAKHGFSVSGFDLRPEAGSALVRAGGNCAATAAEAARTAEMVILMVVDAGQAEAVLGDGGVLESAPDDAIIVLMSTCPPAAVAGLAARGEAAGRRFVDAPVSGGVAGALAGSLTIMAAAPRATFEAVRDAFGAMGENIFHVGEQPGQGATVKAVNQLLCGVHIAVVAEAFSLAAKLGVEPSVLMQIVSGSSAASWMLNDRGPRMLTADPEITSAVDIFVKDLGIVLQAGREAKAALPLAAVAEQLFLATSGRGDGAADDSQVIRTYHLMNGTGGSGGSGRG